MPGNTSDKTTLKLFLEKIQAQYGQAKRIWIMDRGIPTEVTLKEMRQSDPPVSYRVGTPRARWDQFKDAFEKLPGQKLCATVEVKLVAHGEEAYVLAKRQGRHAKRRKRYGDLLAAAWGEAASASGASANMSFTMTAAKSVRCRGCPVLP